MSFTDAAQERAVRFLRWSERYTKTDMVYLAGAGFWSNLNFVIVSVFALLLSIAFANLLPKDVFGLYQYLLSLSALLTAITLAGMNNAVSQSVARGFEGDLRASVRIQLLWSIVPLAIGLVAALYYFLHGNGTLGAGLVVIALLSPLTNVYNTYNAFLQGKREFKRIFTYGTAVNLIYYASIFIGVFFFKDALVLVFINLASNALGTLFVYFRTLKSYKPNDKTDPQTIPFGAHLSAMNAFGTIVTQLDSILVFHFLGAVQLAVYSFASMIPERVGGIFKFVSVAALPKFSNQTREEVKRHIISKTLRAALAGAAMTLAYVILAPFFFHLLFPKYLDALPYTELYSLIIITIASNLAFTALVSLRMQRELYVFNIISPIVLLALQVPLIIYFGIPGILAARVISNLINILLALLFLFFPLSEGAGNAGVQTTRA
ncbi:MAG TPA: oligosaccharide flippase family protein [Candidatus Paceibacterota bacterium]|nr:oligosaccharide flippase family protein [Candidatus Paceibacterota bacterium]